MFVSMAYLICLSNLFSSIFSKDSSTPENDGSEQGHTSHGKVLFLKRTIVFKFWVAKADLVAVYSSIHEYHNYS